MSGGSGRLLRQAPGVERRAKTGASMLQHEAGPVRSVVRGKAKNENTVPEEDSQPSFFADDSARNKAEIEAAMNQTTPLAGASKADTAASVKVAADPKHDAAADESGSMAGNAAREAVSAPATVEAVAEKGSAGAMAKMESDLKETLNQLSQLRSDHRALRDEADHLRRGLASSTAENKALRRCLEMRGVIGAQEFENQYGYTFRHTKGEFMKAANRSAANAKNNQGFNKFGGHSSNKLTMSMPSMGLTLSSARTGKQKKKKDPDVLLDIHHSYEENKGNEEGDTSSKKHTDKQVKFELVEKWLKMSISCLKKSRQDKIKLRPEGDLYRLMANILFPRTNCIDDRNKFTNELKISLQRRELVVDHWDGPNTPLRYAVIRNHGELVKGLLRGKADPDEADEKGITLLHFAVYDNRQEMAAALLTWKANPNHADKLGNTPLFFAPSIPLCRILWEAKANAEALNKKGQTALHLAAQAGLGDVLEWFSAHVSRQILHHHDKHGAGALYYARQAHITPMQIRRIAEARQSNELIHRMSHSTEKEALPSCVTGHLGADIGDLFDDEPGVFGAFDAEEEKKEEELKMRDLGFGGYSSVMAYGSYGHYADFQGEPKEKKKKKKDPAEIQKHQETMLALSHLNREFKEAEHEQVARRNDFVFARNVAAHIGRKKAIEYATKKKKKDKDADSNECSTPDELKESKELTPRSARVHRVAGIREEAAQRSKEYARELRERREQEKKEQAQLNDSKYRLTDIHDNLKNVPDASKWRACTVRNMQRELWEVSQNKTATSGPIPSATSEKIIGSGLTKKRFSVSKVHEPIPHQDLHQANVWKVEKQKLDERMAKRMMKDSEAASRIQSAFRRWSACGPPDLEQKPKSKAADAMAEQMQTRKALPLDPKKTKDKEKIDKLTMEKRRSKMQEELLAKDLSKALERLQTEADAATTIQGAFRRASLVKQEEQECKDDKHKERKARKTVKDDSLREARKTVKHDSPREHGHHDKEDKHKRSDRTDHDDRHRKDHDDHHHHRHRKEDAERRKSKHHHHHHHRHHHRGDKELTTSSDLMHSNSATLDGSALVGVADTQMPSTTVEADAVPSATRNEAALAAAVAIRAEFDSQDVEYTDQHVEKAIKIQSQMRVQLAKKRSREVRKSEADLARNMAATKLQASVRGHQDRKRVKRVKRDQDIVSGGRANGADTSAASEIAKLDPDSCVSLPEGFDESELNLEDDASMTATSVNTESFIDESDALGGVSMGLGAIKEEEEEEPQEELPKAELVQPDSDKPDHIEEIDHQKAAVDQVDSGDALQSSTVVSAAPDEKAAFNEEQAAVRIQKVQRGKMSRKRTKVMQASEKEVVDDNEVDLNTNISSGIKEDGGMQGEAQANDLEERPPLSQGLNESEVPEQRVQELNESEVPEQRAQGLNESEVPEQRVQGLNESEVPEQQAKEAPRTEDKSPANSALRRPSASSGTGSVGLGKARSITFEQFNESDDD